MRRLSEQKFNMENDTNIAQPVEQPGIQQFDPGQNLQNDRARNILSRVKYYLTAIEPVFVKIFNTIFYWTLKFIKAFVGSIFKMILGKEV